MYSKASTPTFMAVDFYCGAGGTTRGLLDAGGYVIAGIDKDLTCEETFRRNNRNHLLDLQEPRFLGMDMFPATPDYPEGQQDDIVVALRTLLDKYKRQAPGVPVIFTICAPCQSFTKFVQRNITSERDTSRKRDEQLLTQALRFIQEFRPEMIMSENVAGIRRGKYAQVWTSFQDELENLGYRTGDRDVCASRFGVPQRRRRSFMLAIKEHDRVLVKQRIEVPDRDPATVEMPVRDAIGELPGLEPGQRHEIIANHQCRNVSDLNRQRLNSLRPGEPNFNFPPELQLACHRRLADSGRAGFGDVYTRIHPDRPSPTITTRFHSISNGRFGHYDPNQTRGLSLHEGALLQSFPAGYRFYGNGMDANAKMIGNAVPPRLSEFMARHLIRLYAEGDQE